MMRDCNDDDDDDDDDDDGKLEIQVKSPRLERPN